MREFTKSFVSASWALSLLGLRQATTIMMPQSAGQSLKTSAGALDSVTQTVVGQMDSGLQGVFRTGDSLQRGMVDLMLGFFNPGNWNPMRWTPGGMQSGSGCGQSSQEWGPMPPRPDSR